MNGFLKSVGVLMVAFLFMIGGCSSGTREKSHVNPLATADATVKAFCDLDGDGMRLTSETWSKILPYIAWSEEAGWDRIVVIEGYQVANAETRTETSAKVSVVYDVAGNLSQDYVPGKKKETVVFTVQKTGAGWKINDPDFMPPHVLMKPVMRHLRETKRLEMADKIK